MIIGEILGEHPPHEINDKNELFGDFPRLVDGASLERGDWRLDPRPQMKLVLREGEFGV